MDTAWRLAWALPLVLAVGLTVVLLLKRFVVAPSTVSQRPARMSLCESLSISDDLRVHLIEVDERTYLVLDSSRHAALQPATPHAGEAARRPLRAPHWLRRLHGTAAP